MHSSFAGPKVEMNGDQFRCQRRFGRSDGPPPEAGRSHALLVVLRPLGRTGGVQRAGELLHELLHLVVVLRLSTIADPELAVLVFDGELIEQPPQTLRQPRAVVHSCSLAIGASAAELAFRRISLFPVGRGLDSLSRYHQFAVTSTVIAPCVPDGAKTA